MIGQIKNMFEITGVANDLILQEVFSKLCHFVIQGGYQQKKNCPDKFHYKVVGLTDICDECELKLCLKFIQRDFNYLDKSYIITKKKKKMNTAIFLVLALVLFDVLGLFDRYETLVVNILFYVWFQLRPLYC